MKGKGTKNSSPAFMLVGLLLIATLTAFAGVASADGLVDNATWDHSPTVTSTDPDLYIQIESYDALTGDLWVQVRSNPSVPNDIYGYLSFTILIDGIEVYSENVNTVEDHYYYHVPIDTLPEGDYDVQVIVNYSWKSTKVDPDTTNNGIHRNVTVASPVVNDLAMTNGKIIPPTSVGGKFSVSFDVSDTEGSDRPVMVSFTLNGNPLYVMNGRAGNHFSAWLPTNVSIAGGSPVKMVACVRYNDSGTPEVNLSNNCFEGAYIPGAEIKPKGVDSAVDGARSNSKTKLVTGYVFNSDKSKLPAQKDLIKSVVVKVSNNKGATWTTIGPRNCLSFTRWCNGYRANVRFISPLKGNLVVWVITLNDPNPDNSKFYVTV